MIGLIIDSGLLYTGTAVWQESGSKLYVFMQAKLFPLSDKSEGGEVGRVDHIASPPLPPPNQYNASPGQFGGLIMFYLVVKTHMF